MPPSVYPLIFHSIQDEIPEASRPLITRLYQLWLILLGTLMINFVACIFVLTSGSNDGGKDLGSSIGYVTLVSLLEIDHLYALQVPVCYQYPVLPFVVQVCRALPLMFRPTHSLRRPIYNGYMKVGRMSFSQLIYLTVTANRYRSKLYTIVCSCPSYILKFA